MSAFLRVTWQEPVSILQYLVPKLDKLLFFFQASFIYIAISIFGKEKISAFSRKRLSAGFFQ